jgi:hypothetical protein
VGHRIDYCQPGAHCSLGIVLVRSGPTEVDHHAVPKVLRDMSLEALDRGGDLLMVATDHLAQILRIEPRSQLGRAYQIAEQHGQLPPFSLNSLPRSRRRCGCWAPSLVKRSDRVEQHAPVPDRGDAERHEVVGGQSRQHRGINVVGLERLDVILQAQGPQPGRDVHVRRPG